MTGKVGEVDQKLKADGQEQQEKVVVHNPNKIRGKHVRSSRRQRRSPMYHLLGHIEYDLSRPRSDLQCSRGERHVRGRWR